MTLDLIQNHLVQDGSLKRLRLAVSLLRATPSAAIRLRIREMMETEDRILRKVVAIVGVVEVLRTIADRVVIVAEEVVVRVVGDAREVMLAVEIVTAITVVKKIILEEAGGEAKSEVMNQSSSMMQS